MEGAANLDDVVRAQMKELEELLSPEILSVLLEEVPIEPALQCVEPALTRVRIAANTTPTPTTQPTPQPAFEQPSLSNYSVEPTSILTATVLRTMQDANQPHTSSNERFGKPITLQELQNTIENRVPSNTKKATNWGYSVWIEWSQARNITEDITDMEEKKINILLAQFVQEVRRKDGKEYPPGSLTNIVAAVQWYLREHGRPNISFFDEKNTIYDLLQKSLDAKLKTLTKKGIGCQKRQAQPITSQMEEELWEKGIFSRRTGEELTNAIFWYSCKLFGLRAGDEHRNLEASQFMISIDETGKYLKFTGRNCKNWQGGLHQQKIDPKELKIYAKSVLGERCAVSTFQYYLSLIPPDGPFYRRPLAGHPPRYSAQVIGVNKLSTIVKNFCQKAGFQGFFTNHSGKVTCATELFRNNIDEQLIMKQTGHRSQDAVRRYKRPSTEHELKVSDVLQPPEPKRSSMIFSKEDTLNISSSSNTTAVPVFNFNLHSDSSTSQNIYITYKQ